MPNWGVVLSEIQKEKDTPGGDSASDKVRKKYLSQLQDAVGRNVICYYSGWLSKPSKIEGLELNDEDKNGFMLCVHKLDKKKGLDLFLHTPGGSGAATQSLVHYLKDIFGNDIRAFVPQIAMSAGTIVACACKEIFMGRHSNLGPVDPIVNGIQAYAVIEGIKAAYEDIMADKNKVLVWNPILSRYTSAFVQQCNWSIQASKEMVAGYLKDNMFSDLEQDKRDQIVDNIVEKLTALSSNQGHDKHIHYQECRDMGLKIGLLEEHPGPLQDLVLTVHHCYMYALSNSGAFKIIENHLGRRFVKLQVQQSFSFQLPTANPGVQPGGLPAASGPAH